MSASYVYSTAAHKQSVYSSQTVILTNRKVQKNPYLKIHTVPLPSFVVKMVFVWLKTPAGFK